jgi:hypothetical protein
MKKEVIGFCLITCLLVCMGCSSKVSKGSAQGLVKEVKRTSKKKNVQMTRNRAKVKADSVSVRLSKIVLERFLDNLLARKFEACKKDVTNSGVVLFTELQQTFAIIPKEQLDELFLVYTKSMYQTITCSGNNKSQTCLCCCAYDGGRSFEPFLLVNENGSWKVNLSTSNFFMGLKK